MAEEEQNEVVIEKPVKPKTRSPSKPKPWAGIEFGEDFLKFPAGFTPGDPVRLATVLLKPIEDLSPDFVKQDTVYRNEFGGVSFYPLGFKRGELAIVLGLNVYPPGAKAISMADGLNILDMATKANAICGCNKELIARELFDKKTHECIRGKFVLPGAKENADLRFDLVKPALFATIRKYDPARLAELVEHLGQMIPTVDARKNKPLALAAPEGEKH